VRVASLVLLTVLAARASAQPDAAEPAPVAPGPAAADADRVGQPLIAEAEQLGKDGKLELALAKVREASVRFPSAAHDCLAALTYFRLGRLTAAELHLDLAVSRGDRAPGWCRDVIKDVEEALARRGYTRVDVAVEPADAIVRVDDVVVRGGHALWLPPGTAAVRASATGFDDEQARPEVPAGGAPMAARLTLHRHVDAPTPPERVRVVTTPTGIAPRKLAGWSLIGGGAVIAGAGAVFHVLAIRARDAADARFTDEPAFASERDRFERDRVLAIGGYAVGGAALIAGVYLIATGSVERRDVDVALVPHGAVLSMSWALP